MWWWFPGLAGMAVGMSITMLMLANSLTNRGPYGALFVRIFAGLLCVEVVCFCGAIIFVVLVET